MKVLIVEDDEAIANLLYMDLSDEGYHCSIAHDGMSASTDRVLSFIGNIGLRSLLLSYKSDHKNVQKYINMA